MNQLMILDYNRVLKSINEMTPEDFIAKISEDFTVTEMESGSDPKPQSRRHISLLLNKKWYDMQPKESIIKEDDPIMSLDTAILTEFCFKKIIGINFQRKNFIVLFLQNYEGFCQRILRK